MIELIILFEMRYTDNSLVFHDFLRKLKYLKIQVNDSVNVKASH